MSNAKDGVPDRSRSRLGEHAKSHKAVSLFPPTTSYIRFEPEDDTLKSAVKGFEKREGLQRNVLC